MKVIMVSFRTPDGGMTQSQFDAEKFKVRCDGTIFKVHNEENGMDVFWIPVAKLDMVQFGETKDEPRIVTPASLRAIPGGN